MAWIEQRYDKHRVYWTNPAGSTRRRDYEQFDSREHAELFVELIAALGGDPLAARTFVRRDQLDAAPGATGRIPALRLDRLRDVYLGTKSAVHPETRDRYAQLIDDHIIGYFGADFDVTLMRAVPSLVAPGPRERVSVSGWLEWMQRQHARSSSGRTLSRLIAPKTIRNVHAVLSEMLDLAVEDPDIRLDRNPCAKSRLPKVPLVEMQFLEKAQFAGLLPLFSPCYRVLVLTLVMTGIRWGEAAGLQMKNLHLDAPVPYLFVCKALRHPKGCPAELGRPKSDASVRQIPLNPKLVEEMRRHTIGLAPGDFVFRMRGGGPLHNGNFHIREWNRTLARAVSAGILENGDLRIHDLRHTNAAWLISAGRPLLTVQRRLGHASIVTTNRYSHLCADVNPADLKVLDDAFPLLTDPSPEIEADLTDSGARMDADERALPVLDLDDDDDLAA